MAWPTRLLRLLWVKAFRQPAVQSHRAGVTGREPAATYLAPAYARLAEFARLGPNWDTYDADPVSSRALSVARRLLSQIAEEPGILSEEQVAPYNVAPLVDGGVQVEWTGGGGDLEVEISSQGAIDAVLITADGGQRAAQRYRGLTWPDVARLLAKALAPSAGA